MKQGRRFRGALNIAMIVSVAGTLPYVFSGGSRYRHEVLGTMAFVLMIYHCMLNRFWFCKVLKKGKMKKNTKRQKLLYAVNMVLAITAVILLIYLFYCFLYMWDYMSGDHGSNELNGFFKITGQIKADGNFAGKKGQVIICGLLL